MVLVGGLLRSVVGLFYDFVEFEVDFGGLSTYFAELTQPIEGFIHLAPESARSIG